MRHKSRLPSRQAWMTDGSRRWPSIRLNLGPHNTSQAQVLGLAGQHQSSGEPSSLRKAISKDGSGIASTLGEFSNRDCKKSSKDTTKGHYLDPHAFPIRDAKQQRIDIMIGRIKRKKCPELVHPDFTSTTFQRIRKATHTTNLHHLEQRARQDVDPKGPKDIYSELTNNNNMEFQSWVASYQSNLSTNGLIVMCDRWMHHQLSNLL